MFLDLLLEYIFWFSPWISYNYRKEDYENKIFNKLNFFCYLTWGTMQLLYILGFAITVIILTQDWNKNWDDLLSFLAALAALFFIFLYIKQTWFAFSLKKPLYQVTDKAAVKGIVLTTSIISFIPFLGYFSTLLFYFYVSKKLRNENFEFIYIWNRRKAERKLRAKNVN